MNEKELLQAFSKMIDEKLKPLQDDIETIKKTMVTKADLRESENMILNELDTVQEKTNQKFNNLKLKIM